MNKTKRVAWHKHLKRARRDKEKAQIAAHAQTHAAGAPARGAVGAHTPPAATRSGTAARSTTSTARQATPRP